MSDELEVVETIRATDLGKLFSVVECAAGLYNALELHEPPLIRNVRPWSAEFDELGDALRELGLKEVPVNG